MMLFCKAITVTLPSPKGRRASEQHRLGGLFPEEPRRGQVVVQATHSDNVGACRPSYYSWEDQGVDT